MTPLKPCPQCRKKTGMAVELSVGRFRHAVTCTACGWSTAYVRAQGVAEKLWNEAKLKK
jgi:transcription elongation factor Elf1